MCNSFENIDSSNKINPYGISKIQFSKQYSTIKNLMREISVPTNFIGYKYIVEAMIYMINSDDTLFLNEIYVKIAVNHCTSAECVEADIRNAIKKACKYNELELRRRLKISNTVKISNSIFLNSTKEVILDIILE